MRSALNVVSNILGFSSYSQVPWQDFDHTKLLIIRNWFIVQIKADGSEQYSPDTINNYLAAVRGVCRHAWKLELMDHERYMKILDEKPVKGTRIKERQKCSMIEVGQIKDCLLDHEQHIPNYLARFRDVTMFTLTACTGIRRSELVGLEVENILRSRRSIKVHGKGNKEHIVPVQPDAFRLLLSWIDDYRGDHDGAIFVKILKNGEMMEVALTPRAVNFIFDRLKKTLHKLDKFKDKTVFNPHNLRHSFATVLRDNTDDLSRIQEILGHNDMKTTVGYFIRDEEANSDLVDSLDTF